jgi:hypothetical protein
VSASTHHSSQLVGLHDLTAPVGLSTDCLSRSSNDGIEMEEIAEAAATGSGPSAEPSQQRIKRYRRNEDENDEDKSAGLFAAAAVDEDVDDG